MTEIESPGTEQPFFSHLVELRDRLMRSVLVVSVVFLVLFPFGNQIYQFVAEPLMAVLPEGTSMIATQVASPFLTPFKLSLVAAVFLAMPYLLHQLWGFVAPGLYQHEKKLAMPLLVSSIALFYLGVLFAYYVVFPLVFSFLTGMAPEGVAVMTDISSYLDFVLTLFFAFGFAFEIPIATILVVWMGMITPDKLAKKRPYVIVGAFVVGMLLTPPDVISQTLLAFPMWVLFELGVIFSRFFMRNKDTGDDSPEEDEQEAAAPAVATTELEPEAERAIDEYEHIPLTEEEMDAELDRIEEEEASWHDEIETEENPVDMKLKRIKELREHMDIDAARRLLYEVLVEGDDSQVTVAKNILSQLDED
jgi:sec-independent protein translocase protein TatC